MSHNIFKPKGAPYSLLSWGFGLVELLVSVSIVLLVTSIIMSRHGSYNGAVLLRSQAYEVALLAREVQLSAVSAVGDESGDYRTVYGLYFNTATRNFYFTFRDANGNRFFESGEQVGARNNIDPRFEIAEIRLVDGSGVVTTEEDLAVVFQRPNFDAMFYSGPGSPVAADVSSVEIVIRTRGTTGTGVGDIRVVEITRTGQIIVQ
jgi:type II secretory pathway pseudopilin PulG